MNYNITDYLEYFNYDEETKSISIYTSIDKDYYSGITKIQFNPPVEYNKYITCDFIYGIFRTLDENGNERTLSTKDKIDLIRYINVKYKELGFVTLLPCYDNITGVVYKKSFNDIEKEELIPFKLPDEYRHLSGLLKYFPSEKKLDVIKYAITDDGRIAYNIEDTCTSCVLYLTEEEYKTFPKPDERYKAYQRYDFVSGTWKDIRTIEDLKKEYYKLIEFEFNCIIKENAKFYLNDDIEYNTFTDVTSITEQQSNVKESAKDLIKSFGLDDIDNKAMSSYIDIESDNLISYKKANGVVYGQYLVWKNYPTLKAFTRREDYLKLMNKFSTWIHNVYY